MNKEFYKKDGMPLELRMYFFVPYQLTGIQQGIQAGHAALEYANKFSDTELFKRFMLHKTWIILNGGTTNNSLNAPGTINETSRLIDDYNNNNEYKINFSLFSEPDLNFALTSICFICDERVFNYEDYPEFMDFLLNVGALGRFKDDIKIFKKLTQEERIEKYPLHYEAWVESLGGKKNVFLRELLKDKKLA